MRNLREYRPPALQIEPCDARQIKHIVSRQEEPENFRTAQDRNRSLPNAKNLGRLFQGKTGGILKQRLWPVRDWGNRFNRAGRD